MKVALIHYQYLRKGGMERYLVDLIKGFTDAGDEVTVITSKVASDVPLAGRCHIININVSMIPKKLRGFFFSRQVNRLLPRRDFDLTISLSRTSGQQIMICGGTHRSYLAHMGRMKGPLARLEISTEQRAYQTSRLIVAHSEMLKDEVINLYNMPPEKVMVIHPPADTDRFSQRLRCDKQELMEKYKIRKDRLSLLFVSGDHKRKGLRPLLRAFKKLPPDRFELIVAGAPLKSLDKSGKVRYVGYVDRMEELYTAVDFTVLPSLYEPFGLVVIESLLCGTPVMISDKVGARDIITDDEGLVFESITPDAIAATILQTAVRDFHIDNNLSNKRGLTLTQHVEKLKELSY